MVLVEYHYYDLGDPSMYGTNGPKIEIMLRWSFRLLYLMLFITIYIFLTCLRYTEYLLWNMSYLGAIASLILSVLLSQKEILDPWDYSYLLYEDIDQEND